MKIVKCICFAVALITPCLAYCQAQTTSWVPCDGVWSNGSNWSGGVAPNNTSTTTYDVTIDVPVSQCTPALFPVVDIDQDVTINSLTLGFNNSLFAGTGTPHTFTILSSFDNRGGVEFFNGNTLVIDGSFVNNNIQGTAEDSVEFGDGGNLISRGLTNNGSLILGYGSLIDARGGAFTNLDSATGTLNGGVFDISGTFRFDPGAGPYGGNVVNIGPNVILILDGGQMLYGPGAGKNALADLASNAGYFGLGEKLTLACFKNSGEVQIGDMSDGGTMIVKGNFINSGEVLVGSTLAGFLDSNSYVQTSLGTTQIASTGTLTAGRIDIQGGLSLAAGSTVNGDLTIEANGHETGQGTINGNLRINGGDFQGARTIVTGNVFNAGTLDDGGKPGSFDIGGNFTMTNDGKLQDSLDSSTSFDQLDAAGLADIGGTLDVTTNFDPYSGETLSILDAASVNGEFSDFVPENFNSKYDHWTVVYTPTSVELVANTPEPSTLVLLGIGFLGLAGYIRRRRSQLGF